MAYFNGSVNLTPSEPMSTDLPPGHSPLKVSLYLQATIITMYTVIVVLAIGGNSIICYIVFRARKMRTVMNFFIVSLALSDILVAVMCIPFTFLANLVLNYWPFGDTLCPIVTFLQAVTVFVSSFTLVSISRDRYVAIIYPLRPKMTKRQTIIIITGIWIISCIIPLPTAILSRTHKYVNISTAPEFCEEIWGNQQAKYGYTVAIWVLQHIIPLMILGFSYGRIIIVLWIKKTPGEAATVRDQRMSESKKKIIKMMITVVVIYAMCWLPLHVITIVGDIKPDIYQTTHMNIVWMSAHWLAMSNCMYNPFIYCWMNAKFRNGFRKVLHCFTCGIIKAENDIELQRMRRQDTVMTSVTAGNSYRRPLTAKDCDGFHDYSTSDRESSK